ncbi:MAG: hypothetical protein HYU02_08825 [Thaumarchaeota archaeon]|nr:hypothetical protein [Nitrososphaerota archaeon]
MIVSKLLIVTGSPCPPCPYPPPFLAIALYISSGIYPSMFRQLTNIMKYESDKKIPDTLRSKEGPVTTEMIAIPNPPILE